MFVQVDMFVLWSTLLFKQKVHVGHLCTAYGKYSQPFLQLNVIRENFDSILTKMFCNYRRFKTARVSFKSQSVDHKNNTSAKISRFIVISNIFCCKEMSDIESSKPRSSKVSCENEILTSSVKRKQSTHKLKIKQFQTLFVWKFKTADGYLQLTFEALV